MTSEKKRLITRILVAAWLPVVAFGLWGFASLGFEPGASGTPGASWPAGASLEPEADRYTLLVALHPECPCSQATLEELDDVMARSGGRLKAYAVYASYPELPNAVEQSRNWRRASRIPNVTTVRDDHGELARQFAVLTSGEVRLYGPAGDLRFHGGITASRGHQGPNPGALRVLDVVLERCGAPGPLSTPAFGCPL